MRHSLIPIALIAFVGGCSLATAEEGSKRPGSAPKDEQQHVYMASTTNGLDQGGLVVRLAPVPEVFTGSPVTATLTPLDGNGASKIEPIVPGHPAQFGLLAGSYRGSVHKNGFESQTFNIRLRKGYVDTLEVVLIPEKP